MSYYKNIKDIIAANLCTGCGTCFALCPYSAIEITKDEFKGIYIPRLDEETCRQCGICYLVCPGYSINFKNLNQCIFGKEPDDILVGNYLNCYLGCATDYNIRFNSSSGGLVTTLLIYALEQGIIDGALVTRMKQENPLEPESFIARTKEEIIDACDSKYCPVAANIALKDILEQDGKYAVVGLPCHLHGIRKAELINKKLRDRIVLHIGLFCIKTISFIGTEDLLRRRNIRKEHIRELRYRGNGYPGEMRIKFKDNSELFFKIKDYYDLRFNLFTPQRCILCCDHCSELADISFGDAWLPEIKYIDSVGSSIVISRNRNAEDLLQRMLLDERTTLSRIDCNKIHQSQDEFSFKKKQLKVRVEISRLLGQKAPDCDYSILPRPSKKDIFCSLLIYVQCILAAERRYWWLLDIYVLFIRFGSRLISILKR